MSKKADYRWRIIHIKSTRTTIGYVEASDADAAIKKAIDELKIDPRIAKRLAAERSS
jgi:hypothetical protein